MKTYNAWTKSNDQPGPWIWSEIRAKNILEARAGFKNQGRIIEHKTLRLKKI